MYYIIYYIILYIVACAYYCRGTSRNPENWYARGMRGKNIHLQMVCARYARGLRKACSHLSANIACGFWGLPSRPLLGDPRAPPKEPAREPSGPLSRVPHGSFFPPIPRSQHFHPPGTSFCSTYTEISTFSLSRNVFLLYVY